MLLFVPVIFKFQSVHGHGIWSRSIRSVDRTKILVLLFGFCFVLDMVKKVMIDCPIRVPYLATMVKDAEPQVLCFDQFFIGQLLELLLLTIMVFSNGAFHHAFWNFQFVLQMVRNMTG